MDGSPVPGESLRLIALRAAEAGTVEEGGIKGRSHAQRRAPVSRLGRAPIEEARRGDVAAAHESIAPRYERREFQSRQTRLRYGHCRG